MSKLLYGQMMVGKQLLVGGFNPFEKYLDQFGSFPQGEG